jgi:N-methylhydantoinase A
MGGRIGVENGGTFIDFCLLNEATQELRSLKVLTTPDKPGRECRRSQPPITAAS